MRVRRGAMLFALLLLVPVCTDAQKQPATTGGAPPQERTPKNPPKKNRPRVERPSHVVMQRGRKQELTYTIVGTDKPVRITFRNRRPDVVEMEGGETITITSSGGTPNRVTIPVMGLSPGAAEIEVVTIDGEEVDRTAEIADAFRAEMARIADFIDSASRQIPVRRPGGSSLPPTVLRADALRLLDRVESDLRLALPYRELTAFHDAVAAILDRARRAFDTPRGMGAKEIILLRNADERKVQESWFRTVMGQVSGFFRDRSDDDPLVQVCFRTAPESGATLLFHPPSLAHDITEVFTNRRKGLYLGKYKYKARRDGYAESEGEIDLLLDGQTVIECTLPRTKTAPHGCRTHSSTSDRCQ